MSSIASIISKTHIFKRFSFAFYTRYTGNICQSSALFPIVSFPISRKPCVSDPSWNNKKVSLSEHHNNPRRFSLREKEPASFLQRDWYEIKRTRLFKTFFKKVQRKWSFMNLVWFCLASPASLNYRKVSNTIPKLL